MNRKLLIVAGTTLLLAASCTSKPTRTANVGVQNTSERRVEVFWTADQCNDVDVMQGVAGICHREALDPHQTADFAFPAGYNHERISIHRVADDCALPNGSDVTLINVADGDFILTTGCSLEKGRPLNLQSANPSKPSDSTSR